MHHLFSLRFDKGDIYPPYSSLRSDPLGVRALYEAFRRLPGVSVSRNSRPLAKLSPEPGWTVFYLGAGEWDLSRPETVSGLERLAAAGARVVVGMGPLWAGYWTDFEEDQEEDESVEEEQKAARGKGACPLQDKTSSSKEKKEKNGGLAGDKASAQSKESGKEESGENQKCGEGEAENGKEEDSRAAAARWGLVSAKNRADIPPKALLQGGSPGLPKEIPWGGRTFFKDPPGFWAPVYTAGGKPVALVRKFGKGSVVALADTYLLSNEGVSRHRAPEFLTWLAGQSGRLVFDESHFGIRHRENTMTLLLRHRLHGLFAGLFVFAFLFAWKSSTRFLPEEAEEERPGFLSATGARDHTQGLASLLRREAPPSRLLSLCFEEWRSSSGMPETEIRRLVGAIEKELGPGAPASRNPETAVQAYNMISETLGREKRRA
jgi:hypothetical protein